jgi:hypothetical protein
MNRTQLIGLLAACAILAAFAIFWFASSPLTPVQSDHPQTTAAPSDLAALAQRVESLEREVARLKRSRVAVAPSISAPGSSERVPVAPSGSGEAPVGEDALAEAIAAEASPVRQKVNQLVRDELANARGEWREVRRAHHEARDSERIEAFAKGADLDDEQVEQLTDLLSGERQQIRQIFRGARETFDFRGARERARELRAGTDQAVADVLDEKQLEKWTEQRAQRRGRW